MVNLINKNQTDQEVPSRGIFIYCSQSHNQIIKLLPSSPPGLVSLRRRQQPKKSNHSRTTFKLNSFSFSSQFKPRFERPIPATPL